jgi:hypothetical protein
MITSAQQRVVALDLQGPPGLDALVLAQLR